MYDKSKQDVELMTEEYELLVKLFADNNLSFELPNKHINHAITLTEYIFDKAKEYVYILSGSLPEIFLSEIRENIINALNKGDIWAESEEGVGSRFIFLLPIDEN
jgi:hypothetical protein